VRGARYAVGKTALALAIAEECLIQQTSLAPMFIRLKGETYARAFGVNYVYFLWALVYEAVFVVITRKGIPSFSLRPSPSITTLSP
jgi:hypothetical protein